jgi:putative redox protein
MEEPLEATARRRGPAGLTHRVTVRTHDLTVDEPRDKGGDDAGPTPQELLAASLASCTAITLELYAERKGWELGMLEVSCEYTPAERGEATNFKLLMRLPSGLDAEQVDRLRAIAAKCPVHRTLDGDVTFEEAVELVPRTGR